LGPYEVQGVVRWAGLKNPVATAAASFDARR
jgi:hypothetical protein